MTCFRLFSGLLHVVVIVVVCTVSGCGGHPRGPEAPELSPEEVGQQAISTLDSNGDGQLDKKEYEAAPGLATAAERVDQNADGKLTAEEIAARVRFWNESGTTMMSGNTMVTYRGEPLANAEITYEPEPFLGPAFKPASGTTDQSGVASMQGQDANFPGVYIGMYRVKITKSGENLPARYNTETTLGCEISDDVIYESGMRRFDL